MSNPPAAVQHATFPPWRFALLLALLVFAAFPQVIFGMETFVARDYGFFVYPLAHFQKECFWHGELPFWNPYNNCGVPFLAQWNTMPLYPPSLIYLVLPLNWSLSFFSLLHLWFAGLGMYFLARRWTGSSGAATFAGAAFAFNGYTLNLLMWPSHIATFSWLPWVVLAVETAWRQGGRKIPVAAFAGALQMLAGGPETILLTWLIVFALWLQEWFKAETPRALLLWRFPVVVLLVIALSAAQLLPFLDLVAHAQRETGYTDLRWSMPGFGLANFLVPMAFGSTATEGIFFQHGQAWTSSYYLGMGVLWLALLAIVGGAGGRTEFLSGNREGFRPTQVPSRLARLISGRAGLLGMISLLGLLCALGENTQFYPALRRLIPQLGFITYPIKFVMVVVFAAPLLAAGTLAALLAPAATGGKPGANSGANRWWLVIGVVLLVLIGAIVAWTQIAPLAGDNSRATWLNGISRAGFLLLTGAVLWVMVRGAATPLLRFAPLGLILVAWLDVLTHEPRQNPTVPPGIYEQNLARTKLAMNPQPELGASRAMLSPKAALALTRFAMSDSKNNFLAKRMGYCANANLLDAVPKVDGFFSLAPREFDGLLAWVYCATNGNWTGLENFMGVSQITAPDSDLKWQPREGYLPLVTAGQRPVFLDDTNALWAFGRNEFDPVHTVYLPLEANGADGPANPASARIRQLKVSNQAVDFEAESSGPALAVVAQTYYHNWQVKIDGRPAPLLRANVAFQAVRLPAGKHQVQLRYRDRAFEIGAAISLCGWAGCLAGCVALRRRETAAGDAPAPAAGTKPF